ncbi:hypothetical protein BUALT_Bualt05G0166100 [Buddleja alternifolia]|uniref:Steroid dehydrogenase n=1 Tax=Buddleja alternifolia TaxID=168488 RepID=A0AAV6XRG0_9LAMI|nr:hypothetical protein BUALT_Bualt05G0166100 [Buddleja alternifolia]
MELHNSTIKFIAILGFIYLSKLLLNFFIWLWIMFFRPAKNLKREYGSWAMVTGSTDGIGRALAFELASKGLNLVLVGRNPQKLELTSKEIEKKHHGIFTKSIVIDFASCRGEEVARIIDEGIKGLDLGILINNAGLAYPYAKFLHEVDLELMDSVIRVNIEGTTWVTKTVISDMFEKKRKGAVVNIGSGSSCCVSSYPLCTIYAATKAYVAMLSKSISLEYKQHGIDVQCQIPLLVATKMPSIKKASFFIPSAETYSKASIRWIGHDQICIPYWTHALQTYLLRMLPDPILDWFMFRMHLVMRQRGLRKDSRIEHSKN